MSYRTRSFPQTGEEGLPQSPPQPGWEKTSLLPPAPFLQFRSSASISPAPLLRIPFRQLRCSASLSPAPQFRIPFASSAAPPRPKNNFPDSFSCHRMITEAVFFILRPIFPRKHVFCGHRMPKWALPFILWPGNGQKIILCPAGCRDRDISRLVWENEH
jgi:hypothetical protein